MISSLANFLMLIVYHGLNQRVSWTLLMYTMGAVCVARIAIEQSRQYSVGYLAALAIAAFVVMSRFVVGSVIFCAGILALIAYLSDRIVHDCTLIDDSQDASGQGLIDFGRRQLKQQLQNSKTDRGDPNERGKDPSTTRSDAGHQPGRTVMYLAIAALPLFGLGQFLLRSDAATWSSAQKYLAVYLFSSLSLLVTTSFLGLRRYLRQRKVDMPGDVTVAWLAGGLAMIGMILSVAYLAPMPGQVLASIEMPEFLTAPKDLQSSSMGWGDEGANEAPDDSRSTANDKDSQDKETQGIKQEKGAPPGQTEDGEGKEGPSGKKDGGDKSGGKKSGEKQGPSGPKSDSQKPEKSGQQKKNGGQKSDDNSKPQESKQGKQPAAESDNQQSDNQAGEKQSGQKNSEKPDGEKPSEKDGEKPGEKDGEKPGEKNGNDPGEKDGENSNENDSQEQENSKSQDQSQDQSTGKQSSKSAQQSEQSGEKKSAEQNNSASQSDAGKPPPAKPSSSMSSLFSALGGIIRFLVMVGLLAVVATFVYLYRDAILAWWDQLWNRETAEPTPASTRVQQSEPQSVPIPFASFRNPIGSEKDPRKIVVVTFQAFEAWTREQGWTREPDETPSEFIRRVAHSIPNTATSATQIVDAYNRIVYGRGKATRRDLTAAKQVWQAMQS